MSKVTSSPPDESLPLCERCGYILQGLGAGAVCPECGKPVAESVDPELRKPSAWDVAPGLGSFVKTSWAALVAPSEFLAHLTTRSDAKRSSRFAVTWRVICSLLFALAMVWHLEWVERQPWRGWQGQIPWVLILVYAVVKVLSPLWIMLALTAVTWCAARLTAWEARYRNLRLPLVAVARGLHYHSVHLAPVALIVALTVRFFPRSVAGGDAAYLYTLCGMVIVAAAYLFFTYWAAMRNILYANR